MSSCYTLSHVLNEVMLEKARVLTVARGQTPGAKAEIYTEAWSSLNAWIESRLCKRKGASVPMLGSFTWEIKYGGDGNVYSRPIFVMSDSFIKEHRIRRQRMHVQPNLVQPEEVNYSKLAIKFSKSLTKDMIFTGTRDIIKKIGDFVDRSYEFEIEFAFGTLKAKERQVRFEFNQARLAAILPENLRVGTIPQQPISYDAMSASEAAAASDSGGSFSNNQTDSSTAPAAAARPFSHQFLSRGGGAPPPPSSASGSSASFQYPPVHGAAPRSSTAPSEAASYAYSGSSSSSTAAAAVAVGAEAAAAAVAAAAAKRAIPPLSLPAAAAAAAGGGGGGGGGGGQGGDYPSSSSTSPLTSPHQKPTRSQPFANTATGALPSSTDAPSAAEALAMAASVPLSFSGYLPASASERPISPGLQVVLMALEEHAELGAATKAELRNRAKARVEEEAYLRSLEHVESEARFEEKTQAVAQAMQEQFEDGLKSKLEGESSKKQTFKTLLDAQKIELEQRLHAEKQRLREGKAAFFLPESAGCIENPPGALPGGPNYRTIKQSLYDDLTFQIRSNAERTLRQKQQDLDEERDYLDHVAMELDLQNIAERVTHLEKQKALLASWERDAHIRNLRKLQVAGAGAVKDYIYVNLPEAAEAAEAKKPGRFSIGYDYRKGKPPA